MPCKYCHKSPEDHANEGKYVRSWCSDDIYTNLYSYKFYEPMTNLEYLEYQYEKTQAIR